MTVLNRRQLFQAGAAALAAGSLHAAEAAKPKFKLGLVTYNLAAQWDLDTLLKICKSVGVSPVEFRTTHKHGVEPVLSKEQRKEVRKKCADAGVEIWGCGTTCEFHAPEKAVVEKNIETCKKFVDLVAELGGRGVKVRPNGLPDKVPVEKTLEQIGKALIPCGDAAKNAGLEIWVEVHGKGTANPPYMKTVMEQCGHKSVGLTWNSNPQDIDGWPGQHTAPRCCGHGSSRATSMNWRRMGRRCIRTASCSACSARMATIARRCARSARPMRIPWPARRRADYKAPLDGC